MEPNDPNQSNKEPAKGLERSLEIALKLVHTPLSYFVLVTFFLLTLILVVVFSDKRISDVYFWAVLLFQGALILVCVVLAVRWPWALFGLKGFQQHSKSFADDVFSSLDGSLQNEDGVAEEAWATLIAMLENPSVPDPEYRQFVSGVAKTIESRVGVKRR